MQNYELLEKLYESKTTVIHKVRDVKDNNIYAMKEFMGFRLNEIQLIKQCQIPFVIKIKEAFLLDENVIVIMEYADQGNLKQFIGHHQGVNIQERVICKILIQLTFVLIYLRENQICYKGLNPENILIHQDQVRLADFGIDNLIQLQKPSYRPPELLFHNKYSYKSVMYQFGLILYELTTQRPLFKFELIEQIKAVIHNGGAIVKLPQFYSKQLRFIIKNCLELQESERLDIRQLVHNENYKFLLSQKYMTFTFEQQSIFDTWCNIQSSNEQLISIGIPKNETENKERQSNYTAHTQEIKQIHQSIIIETKVQNTKAIYKSNLQRQQDEIMSLRPLSSQTNMTQSNPALKTNNLFGKYNLAVYRNRKVKSPIHKAYQSDQFFKANNLDAELKPEDMLKNLIKMKMEQCIETIGKEETVQTLEFLRQGGSIKEFLSKYQDSKHLCIAKHMQDIISFSQI
ncbi:unnamed protein product (macronuclear) [Paramecium tetraurelia]|uniref:non-specific serine/threonine protein kinase n=1 Tax=Paramecium tetraurelia TaxID=5888 RepID=A0D9M6_PARTE|nr:uncharacterized protein GSPATT00014673001 [Paramecium tetraurelia]CAK79743.1 unnamed protein product [Paramecium tetraurelia]|eukprot:XP_001447140.1 hypothetical protein (macronuclear) [Paramecium tetraurelia strain d4-2]